MKVGIVDYGRGNIRSVENAFLAIGADVVLITKPEELESITHPVSYTHLTLPTKA